MISFKALKSTIQFFLLNYKKKKEEMIDIKEKKTIAKVFNDRYAYRKVYDETKPRINGDSFFDRCGF